MIERQAFQIYNWPDNDINKSIAYFFVLRTIDMHKCRDVFDQCE